MKTLTKNLLVAALGLLAIAALLAYPAYRWSKSVRAEMLAEKAEQAYANENFQIAFDHAYSARLMDPDNYEIAILGARAALKLPRRNPFALWEPIMDRPEIRSEHLVELAERLVELRQFSQVDLVLPVLLEKDPDNERGHELYLESVLRDYRFALAERLAQRWIEAGTESWIIHNGYAEALLNYPAAEKREQGFDHLRSLVDRDDELGLRAIRRLLALNPGPEETRDLITRLEAHPLAEEKDRMLALGWRYFREGSLTFEEAHQGVLELLDLESEEDRKEYFTWLSNMRRYELLLEELEMDEATQDGDLYRLALGAMIQSGDAGKVVQLTLDPSGLPISEAAVLILRARALAAIGDQEELDKTLDLAVRLSTLDDFSELESELARLKRWDNLGELYWRLMENRMTQRVAAGKLIFSTYYLKDETGLIEALETIELDQFEGDPNLQNFVAYLKLLYEPKSRLDAAHELEDLMAQHPNLYDFRIVLSLAHLLAGNTRMVERLAPAIPETLPAQQMRFLKVAHHVVTHYADDPEAARTAMADALPFEDLLPRERSLLLTRFQ